MWLRTMEYLEGQQGKLPQAALLGAANICGIFFFRTDYNDLGS